MKIEEMTTQHIQNRIAFFERFLKTRPPEAVYIGDSDYAEASVDEENRENARLAELYEKEIIKLKLELEKRGF